LLWWRSVEQAREQDSGFHDQGTGRNRRATETMRTGPMTAATFPPDSHLVDAVAPSPNHGERRGVPAPDMLLLHYTGMADAAVALERLCQENGEVSAHYFVFEDGRLLQLVAEARRAWHAGEASWAGERDINSRSIGVEIVNAGHGLGYTDFPDAQIETVIALARDVLARHAIPQDRVLAHSDVAPMRKLDPGEKFPWARLAAAGVGLWVEPEPIAPGHRLTLGDRGADVRDLQRRLAAYGYGLDVTGHYDAATQAVVTAFQRHFRPARVDGSADRSTRGTLAKLLAARRAAA
jgi:N-acetylmuramoyl-L-alanine amidase